MIGPLSGEILFGFAGGLGIIEIAPVLSLSNRWRNARVAKTSIIMRIRGSCLCRGVSFEVALPFDRFVHCHCSRCRKATGTAHASNAVVKVGAFRWLVGAEHVSRFDLPTSQSFATSFCRQCGSPLPHATRSGREVIIPAGALDDDPVSKPDRHLHWGSRATWYVHGQDLPEEE